MKKSITEPYSHPVGFIDTIAPPAIDLHATYQINRWVLDTYKDEDGFKDHVLHDLAYQMAAFIKEKMDVFWRTLDNGDTEVEATVRVLNTAEWRDLESQMFGRYFAERKESYTQAWQSKQRLWPIPYGSILKQTNPIVSPHCN